MVRKYMLRVIGKPLSASGDSEGRRYNLIGEGRRLRCEGDSLLVFEVLMMQRNRRNEVREDALYRLSGLKEHPAVKERMWPASDFN